MKVFVDTSGILALLNADDAFHSEASTLFAKSLASRDELFTTNYAVVESIAVLQSRHGMEPVNDLIDNILPVLEIVWGSEIDHQAAIQLLKATNRRRVSFVDCTSFVVMRKLGIEFALASDRDFEDFGFTLLKAQQ